MSAVAAIRSTAARARVVLTLGEAETRALWLMVQTCPVRLPPPVRAALLAALDQAIKDLAAATGDAA